MTCTSCFSFIANDLMVAVSSAQKSTVIFLVLDLDTRYREKLSFCRCVFYAPPWFLWSLNLFLPRSCRNIFLINTWGHFYQRPKLNLSFISCVIMSGSENCRYLSLLKMLSCFLIKTIPPIS